VASTAISARPYRQALATVLENFPADKAIIKRRAVRSAFKVEIVAYAHAVEIVKAAKQESAIEQMFVLSDGKNVKSLLLDR